MNVTAPELRYKEQELVENKCLKHTEGTLCQTVSCCIHINSKTGNRNDPVLRAVKRMNC
jgi:hypothetical protein